ncbi:MAG: DUF2723 domain-containing protein [Prevotellaceae bacterium]|jgi:hypothetical protein|nr:DUF2723 domain-containing protein [Prevotellaceae bacterium]
MKKFRLFETITGWAVFAVAAVVYLMTIEPSASFWDCGEFIASADKLEVGHPPGAPLFILIGRVFASFAQPDMVAKMVNSFSALCSAFTILFLFWTITHLARKIVLHNEKEFSVGNIIAILSAGTIGALAYTFSDTFWFSAVEGEVYAFSSLFTAVVFWCILRWEDAGSTSLTNHSATHTNQSASRWLILIAYLMGLSIGVHLLNLLAIPAIVLVYYFKKQEKITAKGVIIALSASFAILIAVLYGLIPGFTKVAGQFELLFVNHLKMPFNSGLLIYLIAAALISIWAIYETHVKKSETKIKLSFLLFFIIFGVPFLSDSILLGILLILGGTILLFARKKWNYQWFNTILMCMTVIIIGYSSYAMIMIRSAANPPMDQNSPEDVFALQSYLNREQYGDRPLFYGAHYSAPPKYIVDGRYCRTNIKYGSRNYIQKNKENPNEKDSYVVVGRTTKGAEMDSRFETIFPRMYSTQSHHITAYQQWGDVKGTRLPVYECGGSVKTDEEGKPVTAICPTFGENLTFFFKYQVSFMYWRYFMWNFVGRQNDIQCQNGELDHGNWISGIPFIDNLFYGDQSKLPDILKDNKGYNRYFFLPFILGLLGIVWQLSNSKKGKQNFWVTFTLFFMTGIAIVLYLNQTPYQPRERDYAYAGSFYAFCIWIGLGVMAIVQFLNKKVKLPYVVSAILALLVSAVVPALMAHQNWNDHDRSNRYVCRDIGYDYLNTCKQNAVLFCNGDNDTFPLWYNQEVEGVRTDIRSCNLSYVSAPWYIDQMKRGYYESEPLQIDWQASEYQKNMLDAAFFDTDFLREHPEFYKDKIDLKLAFDLMRNKSLIRSDGYGRLFSQTFAIPVDKQKVIENKVVDEKDYDNIVDTIYIKLKKNALYKNDMMVLEMIKNNDWTRPMYFCTTIGSEYYPSITDYLQAEGMAYRFVPVKKRRNPNTEKMYENLMEKYRYGNISDPKVYLDETNRRMCSTLRQVFSELVRGLVAENQYEKAKLAIEKCLTEIPFTSLPVDYSLFGFVDAYYKIGEKDKADELLKELVKNSDQNLKYVLSLPSKKQNFVSQDMSLRQNLGMLQNAAMLARDNASPLAEEYGKTFEFYYSMLASRL